MGSFVVRVRGGASAVGRSPSLHSEGGVLTGTLLGTQCAFRRHGVVLIVTVGCSLRVGIRIGDPDIVVMVTLLLLTIRTCMTFVSMLPSRLRSNAHALSKHTSK